MLAIIRARMSIDVGNEGIADEPVHLDFLPLGDLPRVQRVSVSRAPICSRREWYPGSWVFITIRIPKRGAN